MVSHLNTAVQEEAERRPEVRRLMTHPGVGPTTALAFVLILGTCETAHDTARPQLCFGNRSTPTYKRLRSHLAELLSQKKACDVTGGIGKHGQLGASRHFGRRKDRFASKTFCPIKRCL